MMNHPPAKTTATTIFVVHFWREWTGAESRWRGRVEHVQSGQQGNFLAVDDLLGFFQRFGVGIEPCSKRGGRGTGQGGGVADTPSLFGEPGLGGRLAPEPGQTES